MTTIGRLLGLSGERATAAPAAVASPRPVGNDRAPRGATTGVWYSTPGMPQTPEWDGLTAIRNGYMASIYIMQPVRIIATALGSLPFRFGADMTKPADYDINAQGAKLLGPPPHGPNPVTSPRNLWIWSIVQRLIAGRMAWETVCPPGSTVPAALWPLVAPFLLPIPAQPGTPRWFDGYQYNLPGRQIIYTADQVYYSWRPSQTDWRQPESALQAASMPASLQIALDRYMWALAKNGLAAKKLVITPDFAEDDERRGWEEQFNSEFTGYDNGGKVMHGYYEDDPGMTSAAGSRVPPIQVVDLASSPADAQVLEIMAEVKNDLLRTWRVPLSWMGDASARTYENASQEAKNFWDGPVMEAAAEISDDVNQFLSPRFGDSNVGWFDFSGVEALRAGSNVFAPIAPDAAVAAGLATADDWRNDVGLAPLNPADVPVENLPAIDDTPGGTQKTNFSRATATTFRPGAVKAPDVHDLLEHAYPGSVLDWVDTASWKYDPAVPLDEIKMARRPGGRDMDKVEGIAAAVKGGKPMDPVVLVDTGEGKLEIADGYHRTLGFDRAGKRTIPALIGSGVGEHGPWETEMHAAKLNRSVGSIEHPAATERLMEYWSHGAGAAKIGWGTDGDFDRCRVELGKYVKPEDLAGLCSNLHVKATGFRPGHAPGESKTRDALTESSSAGALLPVGVPKLVAARMAHLFTPSVSSRRVCATCGQGVTANIHVASYPARKPRPSSRGDRAAPSKATIAKLRAHTRRTVDQHAATMEPQLADAMRALFTKQATATLSRLKGRRGALMLTRAAGDTTGGTEEPLPPTAVDATAVFDVAHWTQQTTQALNPVLGTIEALTTSRVADTVHPGTVLFPEAVQAAKDALAGRVSGLADRVTASTFQEISAALAEGVAKGEGIGALTSRIQAVFDDATRNRAETIARTEVQSSINTAADAYATSLPAGIVGQKEWLATPDSRTREAHAEANGQTQPLDQPFIVGGFPLMHPGDMTTAPPSDYINCRCCVLYLPAVSAKPLAAVA